MVQSGWQTKALQGSSNQSDRTAASNHFLIRGNELWLNPASLNPELFFRFTHVFRGKSWAARMWFLVARGLFDQREITWLIGYESLVYSAGACSCGRLVPTLSVCYLESTVRFWSSRFDASVNNILRLPLSTNRMNGIRNECYSRLNLGTTILLWLSAHVTEIGEAR